MSSPPIETRSPSGSLEKPNTSVHLVRFCVVSAIVLVLAFVGGMVPRWRARAALKVESADLASLYVTVLKAQKGTNGSSLVYPGDVRPQVESPIYARASGYLKKLYVDIGQEVKQGDLLAEIDAPELDRQLDQARAEVAQSEASLALARTTATRWQELLKTSSVSEQETAEKTAAQVTQSANTDGARAQLRRLEELAAFKRVVAPFDGIVTVRNVDLGVLINAGAGRELFHLAQIHKLRVFVKVPQASSEFMIPGGEAQVKFAEKPGRFFPAKIVRTAGAIDVEARTLLTELEVDNSKGELLSGAYAEVQFQMPSSRAALVVPSNTLLFRSEGPQLGLVAADGRVELKRVVLGKDFGTSLEILSGITSEDRIILNPSDSLVTGEIVRVADSASKKTKTTP